MFAVAIAPGNHPFPFRTRKLSPVAPMVLGGQPPGRVGHRRTKQSERPPLRGSFRLRMLRILTPRTRLRRAWSSRQDPWCPSGTCARCARPAPRPGSQPTLSPRMLRILTFQDPATPGLVE